MTQAQDPRRRENRASNHETNLALITSPSCLSVDVIRLARNQAFVSNSFTRTITAKASAT